MECLVKVLKGESNNPHLPLWKSIELVEIKNVPSVALSFYLANQNGGDIKVVCDENGLFSNGERTMVLSGGTGKVELQSITGDTVISVSPYSDITKITGQSSYSSGTTVGLNLASLNVLGKLPLLNQLALRTLDDLSSLNVCGNLEYLGVQNSTDFADNYLYELASNIKLKYVYTKNSNLLGSLEDFATGQVSAGRTSGTCVIQCNAYIRYQGNVVGNGTTKTITFDSSVPNGYTIS